MKFKVITQKRASGGTIKVIPIELSLPELKRNQLNDYLIKYKISLPTLVKRLILEELEYHDNIHWFNNEPVVKD